MIVYDVTDRDSFDNVRNWMGEIDKFILLIWILTLLDMPRRM